jgi:hypothetical protein
MKKKKKRENWGSGETKLNKEFAAKGYMCLVGLYEKKSIL